MILIDESSKILSQLHLLKDPSAIDVILGLIERTSANLHAAVYMLSREFWDRHGRFPDFTFLKSQFPGLDLLTEAVGDFTEDSIAEFIYALRVEAAQIEAQQALAVGDFAKLATVGSSLVGQTVKDIQPYTVKDSVEDYDKFIERGAIGIRTGVKLMDDVIVGMTYGTTNIIAAPPGCGKTTLAVNIAYNAILSNFRVCFMSFELPKRNMYWSFISRHSRQVTDGAGGIEAQLIHKGLLGEKDLTESFKKFADDFAPIADDHLVILGADDLVQFDSVYLDSVFNSLDKRMGGLDLVVLDYVQLLRWYRPKSVDVATFVNDLVTYFMMVAKRFHDGRGLIVLLLSQMNRDAISMLEKYKGERGASLTGLAEFNALERDAHTVLVMFSTAAQRMASNSMFQWIKNRTGPTMPEMQVVRFEPAYNLVGDLADIGANIPAGVERAMASQDLINSDLEESAKYGAKD